jgi:hypothetical protein
MIESRWSQSPLTLADLMVGPHGSMSAYITADNYQVQSSPPRLQGPHLAFMQAGQHYDSAFAYLFTTSRISLSKESRRQDRATSVKLGWMQSRMMRMWRVLEPIPIRDAAPMSAAGFAGVAIEELRVCLAGSRRRSLILKSGLRRRRLLAIAQES